MTNFEKHKDRILELDGDFALMKNGELTDCCRAKCENCIFNPGEEFAPCKENIFKWLCEEYEDVAERIENLKKDMCDTVTKFTEIICLVVKKDCAKCPIYRLKQEINLVGYSCGNTLETIINAGIDALVLGEQVKE